MLTLCWRAVVTRKRETQGYSWQCRASSHSVNPPGFEFFMLFFLALVSRRSIIRLAHLPGLRQTLAPRLFRYLQDICTLLINHSTEPASTAFLQHCLPSVESGAKRRFSRGGTSCNPAWGGRQRVGADRKQLFSANRPRTSQNGLDRGCDFPEMVPLQLNHGTNPGLVSHCGVSPMRAAKFWKGEHIVVALRARGVSGFPDADEDRDAEAVAVPEPSDCCSSDPRDEL